MRKFMTTLTTVASLSLAAIPVLSLTQAAHAAEPVARIAVGDLNLSNPAQAAVFKARVEAGAEALCRAKARQNTLDMSFNNCREAVRREVNIQLSKKQRQDLQFAARAQAVELAAQ
jgi:UrcA family protein